MIDQLRERVCSWAFTECNPNQWQAVAEPPPWEPVAVAVVLALAIMGVAELRNRLVDSYL